MKAKGHQGHGNPQSGEHGTNLAEEIACPVPVVPDFKIAVDQQTADKLLLGYDAGTCLGPKGQRQAGAGPVQLPDQQKTGAAGHKHTAMGTTPPEQLDTHIGAAAQIKQNRLFPEFH